MNIYDKIVYYYEELNMRNPVKGIWFRTETILNVTIAFYIISIILLINKHILKSSSFSIQTLILLSFVVPFVFNLFYLSDKKMYLIYKYYNPNEKSNALWLIFVILLTVFSFISFFYCLITFSH
jgi:energy-coupling factor transporter transmembrane protein EcfT